MKLKNIGLLLGGILFLAGCQGGLLYKPDTPQGTRLSERQVKRLQAGMTENEVVGILGTPTIQPIVEANRWDYVYLRQPGSGNIQQASLILWFEKGKLAKFVVDSPENLDP